MTKDEDLDIMNSIKDLPEEDAAFYLRGDPDGEGFYYYSGSIEDIGNTLLALMETDKSVLAMVAHAVNNMEE